MIRTHSKKSSFLLTLFLIFFLSPQFALATDSGPLSPGTMADDSSIGVATWTNVNNAMASDDVYATAQSVCFVAGTKIRTLAGEVNIESLQEGQYVLGFDLDQTVRNSRVAAVGSREVDQIIVVVTDSGEVTTTAEHPFYIGNGLFEQIQNIEVGEYIYDADFVPRQILSKTTLHERTMVYNLEVENTHTYFANSFAVHNKTIWHYLKATNFGFAIPTGATINGITAGIEMITNNGTGGIDNARIVKGGVVGSTDRGIFNNNMPLTEITTYYGSSADLWGETWTAEDINSSDFGLAYSVNINAKTVSVDHMSITVTYTPDETDPSVTLDTPLTGATISGSSVSLTATASDDISVAGVKFYIDGVLIGSEDTTSAYTGTLDSTSKSDGSHTIVAVARDTANNYATSTAATVTIDNTAPVISSISAATPSTTGTTITWTTNESSNSKVSYGTAASTYTGESSSVSSVTSHSITLENLTPSTPYFYVVVSADAAGNISTSTERTFGTDASSSVHGSRRRNLGSSAPTVSPVAITTNTPPQNILPITKDLKFGMTDFDVVLLQKYLNTHGFSLAPSGAGSLGNETSTFGSLTRAALIAFQKAKGISPAVGYFGPITRAYMQR